jgi:DNA polymerase-1
MRYLVLDTETTGLNPYAGDRVVGIGLCWEDLKPKFYVWSDHIRDHVQQFINEAEVVIMHNAVFDMKMLQFEGITFPRRVHDTMGMARLLNENMPSIGLKPLSKALLKDPCREEEELKRWFARAKAKATRQGSAQPLMCQAPNLSTYCKKDTELTMKLFWLFKEPIKREVKPVYELERRLLPVTLAMEDVGVGVDLNYCKEMIYTYTKLLQRVERDIFKYAGVRFNLNSHPQIQEILHKKMKLPILQYHVSYTADDSMKVLERFKHPIGKKLVQWRHARKLIRTYFEPFLAEAINGTFHPSFKQFGTRTGRYSSNFQQLPRGPVVRQAITPRRGYRLLFLDYSQIEMRIFAHLSQDTEMLSIIEEGGDLHARTAERVFGSITKEHRQMAKSINFGIIYGMGSDKFANELGIPEQEAADALTSYHRTFPGVDRYAHETRRLLERQGYLQDAFGRRYHIPMRYAYKGVNALVQGGAASLLKSSMVRIHSLLQSRKSRLVLTVHDELAIELHKTEKHIVPELKEAMTNFRVYGPQPIEVKATECLKSWGEKE